MPSARTSQKHGPRGKVIGAAILDGTRLIRHGDRAALAVRLDVEAAHCPSCDTIQVPGPGGSKYALTASPLPLKFGVAPPIIGCTLTVQLPSAVTWNDTWAVHHEWPLAGVWPDRAGERLALRVDALHRGDDELEWPSW